MKIYNFAFIHPWANGDRYDGEWLDGFRHGKGTLFDNETHKYVEGVWKESKIVEKKKLVFGKITTKKQSSKM